MNKIRHIKWPSIEQFRNVVKNVEHKSSYVGMDDNGDPVFNKLQPKPTLKFSGTCKLHGTNGGVCVNPDGELWVQSRENIITPEKDNAGFAMFVHSNKEILESMAATVFKLYPSVELDKTVVIFGEWCGTGIQKGVAISELPKMFVVFGIALVDNSDERTYLTGKQIRDCISLRLMDARIYCIYDFPTFEIDIDFENPHIAQNKLSDLTLNVENECPVGKIFGVSGIGEGIVWKCVSPGYENSGFWFKTKGMRHVGEYILFNIEISDECVTINGKITSKELSHELRSQFEPGKYSLKL